MSQLVAAMDVENDSDEIVELSSDAPSTDPEMGSLQTDTCTFGLIVATVLLDTKIFYTFSLSFSLVTMKVWPYKEECISHETSVILNAGEI